MKRLLSSIITLLPLCGISSCVEHINLDSDKELPVVVNCVLTRDSVQTLKLSRARVLSQEDSSPIENAEAFLLKKNRAKKMDTVAVFHKADGTEWKADFRPEYGIAYTLLVRIPGEEEIRAFTRFPEDLRLIQCGVFIRLDSTIEFTFGPNSTKGYGINTAEIREGNYYTEWKGVRKKDGSAFKAYTQPYDSSCIMWVFPHTYSTDAMPQVTSNQPETGDFNAKARKLNILDEEYYTFKGTDKPYSKLISTNHPGADRFNIAPGSLEDMNYWKRRDTCIYNYDNSGFSFTSINYSQWCYFLHPDFPIFNGFVRIEHPEKFNNGMSEEELKYSYLYSDKSFFIAGDHPDDYSSKGNFSFINEVHFVSDEYDKYLREMYVRMQNSNDFILDSYDYSNVYTNIAGGVGIFGADNITWDVENTSTTRILAAKDCIDWKHLCPDAPAESFW